jgi:2-amino-4-hydroxy-6-hydroxymethyldihydropteridine diphosphokinase
VPARAALRRAGGGVRAAAPLSSVGAARVHGIPAYVGIGSNLRDPVTQVRAAFTKLAALPKTLLVRCSSLFGSRPMGPVAQPDFCNAVAGILTEMDAPSLHAELRAIEVQMGREPQRERWGPRVIDLDLLAYGDQRRSDPELTLPHPGIAARAFVLRPWCEVAPDFWVPGVGRVAALAEQLPAADLWRIA